MSTRTSVERDLALYTQIAKKALLFPPGPKIKRGQCRWLYSAHINDFKDYISADPLTLRILERIENIADYIMANLPSDIRQKAYTVFEDRNRKRGGLWRDVGAKGACIEIHAKLARLANDEECEDSLIDLFNYCAIFKLSIREGLYGVGEGRKGGAIVTGVRRKRGRSLGAAIARILELNGYSVFLVPPLKGEKDIKAFFNGSSTFSQTYKPITLLINNYGINYLERIGEMDGVSVDRIFKTNSIYPLLMVDEMVKRNFGPCRVLNICSQTYRVPQRCTSAYCGSKAALAHMTRVMARELAPGGWVVNGIAPGLIEGTDMSEKTNEQVLKLRNWDREEADRYARSLIPMGRYTNTEEVAEACYRLIEMPPYVNGAILDMTGGQ